MKPMIQENARSIAPATPLQVVQRSRPMLLMERTMYREGRTPFASIFTLKLSGRFEVGRLHRALERVQAKHPLLRCTVEESAGRPQFVLQKRPAPIPLHTVERIGEDDWQAEVRREWILPFDTKQGPLVRFVWLRSSDVHELILVAHHCICDGYTGINLLHELLGVYDQPQQDLGQYEMLGAVEDIVPSVVLNDRAVQSSVRRKELQFRLMLILKRFTPRKKPAPRVLPEQMYFYRWYLDRDASTALTKRCSTEGVTVLAAAGMAFMQAFRDVRGLSGLQQSYTMVNARGFLPQLRADAMFGLVPGIPLLMKDIPAANDMAIDSFWTRARAVKADMSAKIGRLGARLYKNLLTLESMHDRYASMVADTENAPVVRHVTFSNMGRIDLSQQYREFRIEAVYSPLVMVSPSPANTIVLSSFAGQMEFAIISDEVALPYAQARTIEQRAMQILHTAVALPVQKTQETASKANAMRPKTI